MFVGHALLAFALSVLIADWRGWSRHRVLAVGVVAGAFAAIPDVDVAYALFAMDPTQFLVGTDVRPGVFWETANDVHRSMTHSLIVAAIAGPAVGLWTCRRPDDARGRIGRTTVYRLVALGTLATLVGVSVVTGGPVAGFVMTTFALASLGVATLSRRYLDLSPRVVALAAVAGLASHPWGDLLTGEPPRLFYPVDVVYVTDRVVLTGDPTLHLLLTFALELAVVALAAVVVARLAGHSPRELVHRRAALGAGYGVAALVLAPPTIHVSYEFVFSILTVGVVCSGLSQSPSSLLTSSDVWYRLRSNPIGVRPQVEPIAVLETVFTGLAAIAVALGSYAVIYIVV